MGHRKERTHHHHTHRSHTLPSSPTHSFSSSSSSDFEFTITHSPRKSTSNICPADELFYKGQLLPLHLSPRISMVRTLLLSSSSTSSSSACTDSRHSSDSHSSFSTDAGCDSSRPSSVADGDLLPPTSHTSSFNINVNVNHHHQNKKPPSKYFSLSRFSSVFRKEPKSSTTRTIEPDNVTGSSSSVKRISVTAKEVIRRYFKKAKPLYEKLSQKQGQGQSKLVLMDKISEEFPVKENVAKENKVISHSFSGNLRYPRKKTSIVSSCPSSMRSSPSHSGILSRNAVVRGTSFSDTSSMDELQNAIQGAIAHCKNSLTTENKALV